MHYQSLTAALKQYSGSLTHYPASPNSLALHINRQTQGRLKLHTPDGISLSLTYNDEPVFWSFFSHDLYVGNRRVVYTFSTADSFCFCLNDS